MPLGIDFTQIFLHLFNVVILFTGLYVLLYNPVRKFMADREEHYKQMDEEARKTVEDAEKLHKAYDDKMKAVDEEIAVKRRESEAEIDKLRAARIDDAKADAAKIIDSAKKEAESTRAGIVSGAKEDISKLIEEAARKITLEGEDSYDSFFESIEEGAKDGGK